MNLLRKFWLAIPTLFTAFLMAVAVWILAVNAADPNEERLFPRTIPIEIVGQDPGLLFTSSPPDQLSLTLSAPRSIWDRLVREQNTLRAVVDLSGKGPGQIILPVQVQISLRPVKIISYSPENLNITLEAITSRTMTINFVQIGDLAVGFQSEQPVLSQSNVILTGPTSLVKKVSEVRATMNLKSANKSLNQNILLQILDANGVDIKGLTITPDNINVTENITQRGGFRNVVVKVMLNSQVARGYRVTNISVLPSTVTVFSTDPELVNGLPGYVETSALDMSNVKENLEMRLSLSLPPGINIIGDQTVDVQVGVSPIESSLTLNNMPVSIVGLDQNYQVHISPASVDVILSGPLPSLDSLLSRDVHVVIDLSGVEPGTSQRIPNVELNIQDLRVQSVLPASVEVIITPLSSEVETPTVAPSVHPTVSPTKKKG